MWPMVVTSPQERGELHMKSLDDMSIEELQSEHDRIENESYNNEYQYEFARQEMKEIKNMIDTIKREGSL